MEKLEAPRSGMGALFTIGYQGRYGAEVIALLRQANVRILVDVRSVPTSRKPEFRKNAFTALLAEAGIDYYACAELGTPKWLRDRLSEDRDYPSFFRDYRRHMREQPQALADLTTLVRNERIALMCFEAEPRRCHRLAIADELGGLCDMNAHHLGLSPRQRP